MLRGRRRSRSGRAAVRALTGMAVAACALGAASGSASAQGTQFQITYQPDSWIFDSYPFGNVDTTFSPWFPMTFTVSSQPSGCSVVFGYIRLNDVSGAVTPVTGYARANYTVSAQSLFTPSSGSAAGYERQMYFGYEQYYYPYDHVMLFHWDDQAAHVTFNGGSLDVEAQMNPPGGTIYANQDDLYQMTLGFSFALTDPAVSVTTGSARLNTSAPAASASPAIAVQIANTANAFVDSLTIDYGDGTSEGVFCSQVASLTFTKVVTHTFALAPGEDSHTFHVAATAVGPADGSPDDDTDTGILDLALLRSPDARAVIDGAAVGSSTVLDVLPGQVLAFDGLPSVGFIEDVWLGLAGTELATATSPAGAADETFQTFVAVPNWEVGHSAMLEYCASNTGSGLNVSTWSATLNVIPEPATLALIACGAFCVLTCHRAPRRKP